MKMIVHGGIIPAVGRLLMNTHRIGERCLEKVVVTDAELDHYVGQLSLFGARHSSDRWTVAPRYDHRLKGPDCPMGDKSDKGVVGKQDSLSAGALSGQIGAEQTAAVRVQIALLLVDLLGW